MAAIYTTLFWCALQVSIFLALALPIYLIVRRRNSSAGAATAASSLSAVVLLSFLAVSPWPRWSLDGFRHSPRSTALPAGRESADSSSTPQLPSPTAAATLSPLAAMWEAMQLKDPIDGTPTPEQSTRPESRSWATWIVSILLAGMLLGLAHLAISLLAVRRLIARSQSLIDPALLAELNALRSQLGITRPVTLCVSQEIATPATVGTRRPVLLLPSNWQSWSLFERRAVLAHELAHIAGRDFAAWLIARAAIVLHFYHPLVRWFVARLQLDQELAADATAARLLGDRNEYLHALANLALGTPPQRGGGLVRTFIPGRSLLVRRVEMLRTNQRDGLRSTPSSIGRWALMPLLAALAVVAAGLRAPDDSSLQAAEPEVAAAEPAAPRGSSGYEFAYLPKDFVFLIAIRPSEIAASPHLKPLAELMNETLRPKFRFENLEQMTFVVPVPVSDERGATIPGTGSEYTIFRTATANVDFKPLIEAAYGTTRTEEYKGKQLLVWGNPPGQGTIEFYSPVAGTLISTPRAQLIPVIDNPKSAEPSAAAVQWIEEAKGPLFGVVNMSTLKATFGGRSVGPFVPMLQPIFDLADDAIISVEDGDPLTLKTSFTCRNPEDAARVEQTLQAGLVMIKNVLAVQRAQLSNAAPSSGSDQLPLLDLADQLVGAAKVTVDAGRVEVIASMKNPSETIRKSLIPQLLAARQAAERDGSMNSLKQLALAALNYESRFGAFPSAVVNGKSAYGDLNPSGDNAAPVPRSWRVELLPLLGHEALYKEYRLDQPWDSEANLAVLRKMPDVFRSPNDEPTSTNASYFALTGAGTVFDGNEGTELKEIVDGTSNALLFAEAKRAVPWTKPEDVPYDAAQPLPALGGWRPDEFLIVLCDGSVLPVANHEGVDKNLLKPWIEKSDGQMTPRLFPAALAP